MVLPDKFFSAIDKKAANAEAHFTRATDKYLTKLQRREEKLKRKLWKKDSLLARELFGDVKVRYAKLRATTGGSGKYSDVYSPRLDSISTALNFVDKTKLSQNPELQKTLSSLKEVQEKLNASDQVKKQLQQRQRELKEQFQKLGMVKELKKFRQDVYYYQRQIQEYRQLWEDPSKLERKLLDIAMKLPQFKDFFQKNSQLGSLFALPGGSAATSVSLVGLQTRASVQQALLDRFGSGPDVTQMLQQNVQNAQGQLNELKAKAQSHTSGSFGSDSDLDMPEGFKPNNQKTKSFLQRLELGTNIQSQRARYYFPVTTDIALSAGYKLNNKSIIGIGVSYKAGLGRGWDNVALSHEGLGLRSFIDYKLKGSLYITGGYEQNYLSSFQTVEQLKAYSSWQTSGLIGLSKPYKVSKKLKGEMKLLWDFMSYQQIPKTQAVLFRVGYSLK